MPSFTVTAKDQVTLKRDALQYLGIKPGGRVDVETVPNGVLRVRAAWPAGTLEGFLHGLAGKECR